jgi:hypothetical protein
MKITIESTDALTTIDRVPVRVWEGVTEDGIPCKVFVHRIAVADEQDASAFDRELREQLPPGPPATDPGRPKGIRGRRSYAGEFNEDAG